MTLLELGQRASHYDSGMAHAMIHAVAIAHLYGSEYGWK